MGPFETAARPRAGDEVSRPGDATEREAEREADRAADRAADQGDWSGGLAAAALGGVRIHTDAAAAASAARLGALAFTRGDDVSFARGQFAPRTRSGARLLAHELAHVVQARRPGADRDRVHRQVDPRVAPPDPAPQSRLAPVNTGTFVLDPALAGVTVPPRMATHVAVTDPFARGPLAASTAYVEIERPVRGAWVITVYAVPAQEVFDNPAQASTTVVAQSVRVLPTLLPGAPAWTPRGQFTVTGSCGDLVFSDTPVPEAVGAGSVVLVRTDAGPVLLDSGQQLTHPSAAGPVGHEVARRMLAQVPVGELGEAVLLPGAAQGHNLPMIAEHYAITHVRATVDQYADPRVQETVQAVRAAQATYRQWLERSVRADLEKDRAVWEARQPIAINAAVAEQRWSQHLERAVGEALGRVPVTELRHAETAAGGVTRISSETGPPTRATPAGPIVDMSETRWQPSDDEVVVVVGGGSLTVLSSRGLLMRPAPRAAAPPPAPATVTVSGLRAPGPTGPTPASARPATSWVAAEATGKAGQVMVRTGDGPGVLVDAGGAERFLPERAIRRMVTELGVSSFDTILITHPHDDHVRAVVEAIRAGNVHASRFVTSANWNQAGSGPLGKVVRALQSTTDQRLLDLGYGRDWRPGAARGGEAGAAGVTRATIQVAGGEVEVYTRGEAHDEIRSSVRQGRAAPGHVVDSSSLLYVLGNPTTPHRVAVIGDLRGEDILALAAEMNRAGGPDAFGRALTGVRVLVGFGHHLGLDAGSTPADVRGYELLFRETLLRTGELTIVVQSRPTFSFGGDTPTTRGQALLEFATRMGARVVFAGEPGPAGGGAVIGSDLTLRTHGTGVQVYEPDVRTRAALERLQVLREARRTVTETTRPAPTSFGQQPAAGQPADIGPQQLRLDGTSAEIAARLQPEITRIETLLADLLGRSGADLLDARGEGLSERTRTAFRAERTTSGLTVEQIHAQLAERGPVESALQPEVVAGLRAAARHGSTLGVEAELLATPRGVSEAIARLPEARRAQVEELYRRLVETAKAITGNDVPAELRLTVLHQVEQLRVELRRLAGEVTGEARAPVDAEVARLSTVVEELMKGVDTHTVTGHDAQGRLTRTEYRMAKPPDRVDRGFARVGQAMGAVMVVHSVEGLAQTAAGLAAGSVTVPEAVFRAGHAALSISIGVKMVRLTPVGPGAFVALAFLEVGSVLTSDFATSEERDQALAQVGVNQLCMAAGMGVMHAGTFVPHPLGKALVMGLGLAITLAGPTVLRFLGLDEWLRARTGFAPTAVTYVDLRINQVLDEYETVLGAAALGERTDAELTALGARDPATLRTQAATARRIHTEQARRKEAELMGLFREAYASAGTSYAGLRGLDAHAARFSRLRHAAFPGDPQKAEWERQFLAMDPQATVFRDADVQTVRSLEQWTRLRRKTYALHEALSADPVRWPKVFEEMSEAQQMVDNARYRVDSTAGGHRPTAMLAPGSPAFVEYAAQLALHERELTKELEHAARLAGDSGVSSGPTGGPPTGGRPMAGLALLQSARRAYDDRVAEVARAYPELASPQAWADSTVLARLLELAHRHGPGAFHRLRLTEMVLQSAIGQARAATLTSSTPDPALAALIEREAASAERAIEERRVVHGLVLPHEIDAELVSRRTVEDRSLAARIDTALPGRGATAGGSRPTPLSEPEITALRTGELASQGRRMSSTEHQLAKAWAALAPIRSVDLGAPLSLENSSRVARSLVTPSGTGFYRWDTDWIDSAEWHDVPPGRHPLLARVPGDFLGKNGGFFSGPAWYTHVVPINADAVDLLGPDQVSLRLKDLRGITVSELDTIAEAAAPRSAATP